MPDRARSGRPGRTRRGTRGRPARIRRATRSSSRTTSSTSTTPVDSPPIATPVLAASPSRPRRCPHDRHLAAFHASSWSSSSWITSCLPAPHLRPLPLHAWAALPRFICPRKPGVKRVLEPEVGRRPGSLEGEPPKTNDLRRTTYNEPGHRPAEGVTINRARNALPPRQRARHAQHLAQVPQSLRVPPAAAQRRGCHRVARG